MSLSGARGMLGDMSAYLHENTMDPRAPGTDIFVRARGMLTDLGYEVEETWRHGTLCDAVVLTGGEPICRVEFSATPDRYSLNVLPLDPKATNLIVDVGGRSTHPEQMWTNDELDHFGALFRALRVREGELTRQEFPSDYSLMKWLALASTVLLPTERTPRRSVCEAVAIRPLEAPVDRHPSRSLVSRDLVRTARLLDASYDRDLALGLALTAARQDPPRQADGKYEDPALGWLAQSARMMIRDRRRQMDLAWNMGSYNRSLFAPIPPGKPTSEGPLTDADIDAAPEPESLPALGR